MMTMSELESAAGEGSEPTALVGVTGCIAAYKTCELVRLLQKAGVRVKVVMTPMGAEFVTPATFRALTRTEVALAPIDDATAPIHHISLAQEADVFIIAPATANTINKLANGVADNLLTTTALATEAPMLIAPAMNVHMWRDETTQASLARLRSRGVIILEPEAGYLACGELGEGRLAAVEEIARWAQAELERARDLGGRRVLITAGPTREYIDPVRFLSNPSSGATGYAIAEEAARRGAEVVLVSGPTTLSDPFGCTVVRVTSAREMFEAAERAFDEKPCDAAVFTAAVADYQPAEQQQHKLKKGEQGSELSLRLVATTDILKTLAARKGSTVVVGFAAETRDVIAAAERKLREKNADLIVANDVSSPELGFASAHNHWHFVSAAGVESTDVLPKRTLARLLLDAVASRLAQGNQGGEAK
ncbi:MAG: bifunctional phosphopantothenoylcysteine decarboxylase/phosphopantothenate--cysteine ligase CoaBC [Coriobacteriales bacterium]|jgi:phosphopantothenoylcysteine decarboxylase/phosphopantothenate--cysteine ligase|nr:bifunctional phosphopantothenoylcysteine decarboxylase/phosphopantothenate--cysteine ligase CoaBC [Coriobacteriales bacterium]